MVNNMTELKIKTTNLLLQNNVMEAISLAFEELGNLSQAKELVGDLQNIIKDLNLQADSFMEIIRFLVDKQKINGVKYIKETMSLGLKESKDLIEAVDAYFLNDQDYTFVLPQPQPIVENNDAVKIKALELVGSGQKLEAIKYVREQLNIGLKEAKDFVDNL